MKQLMSILIILSTFIICNAQSKSWELKLLQQKLVNEITYEAGMSKGTRTADEKNEFLIVETQITNKKDADSAVTAEDIFIKDIQNNKRYNLKAISLGKYTSSFLISLLRSGRVMQIEKGGSYTIGRDNENEAMEIKFHNKISTAFLFFELPKSSKRKIQLFFGDFSIALK